MTATRTAPAPEAVPAPAPASGSLPRRARHLRLGTALAVLALLTAACSGGTGAKDDTGGSAGNEGSGAAHEDAGSDTKKEDQALEYRKCLRDQGLDVPEPKPGQDSRSLSIGGDLGKEQMEKAFKACRGKSGGAGAGSGEPTQADKDKMIKYAACMRKNGVNMPDPKFDGSMQKAMPMPKAGPEKDTFDKAMKACEGEGR
ncbi:hypothetical protein ACFYVL_32595 [Streptomyces sp. NPDC004111]|uniref:hypothetical protein n=1 Tax=Streptomyces sp. NPDC004111 TaxID=3364690 RepID=UPI0036BCCCFB